MVQKRTFLQLREHIIHNLAAGRKTANQVSAETGIGWKTVAKHVIHLRGTGLVKLSFTNGYMKVFELTDQGKEKVGIV